MIAFAELLERLVFTPSRSAKIALLRRYFLTQPDPDRGIGLAAITGALRLSTAKPGLIRALAAARTDPTLFALSYAYVGDLAETVALMWPAAPTDAPPPRLAEVVAALEAAPKAVLADLVALWLDACDASVRLALLKLITGGLRVGVSARLAKVALGEIGKIDADAVEEVWHGLTPPYLALFAWLEGRAPRPDPANAPVFRPLMLAHPLEDADLAALDPAAWRAEWKWDGIRVQLVATPGGRRLYSRGAEDISAAFPEIVAAMNFGAVLDGELLVMRDGPEGPRVGPFAELQQRLNRKTVSAKLMAAYPVGVRLYDMLFEGDEDLRALPFDARRARLEAWHARVAPARTDLSAMIGFAGFDELARRRAAAREAASRGADAEARRQRLCARAGEGAVVEVEARSADRRCRADVCAARPRRAQLVLFRLHVRAVARGRAGADRQGVFRLHRPGVGVPRPLDSYPYHRAVRPGAGGGEGDGAGGGVRRGAALEPAQIRRGAAVSADRADPGGQAGGGGGPAGDAARADRERAAGAGMLG